MIDLSPPYRRAAPDDAGTLVDLVTIAGEGLPECVWSSMAEPGESVWDVGRSRALRQTEAFSYRNATVRDENGTVVSCLIGHPLGDRPKPLNYDELPALFVPLRQLEDQAAGTWYVNVLASYPEYRNRGYGSALLAIAERMAVHSGKSGLSIIVSDANEGARRLYRKHGYREYATRPMVKEDWQNPGEQWVLLIRNV